MREGRRGGPSIGSQCVNFQQPRKGDMNLQLSVLQPPNGSGGSGGGGGGGGQSAAASLGGGSGSNSVSARSSKSASFIRRVSGKSENLDRSPTSKEPDALGQSAMMATRVFEAIKLKLHSERGAAGDYGNQSGGGQSGGGQPAGGQAGGGSTNDLLHSDRSRLLAPSRIGHNNHHHHGRHGQVKDARLADYSEEELAEYRAVFNIFDTDRSGAIGLDELEAAMKNLGLEPTQEQLELIIDEVDQIGNHEIDFPEFCDVMRRLTAKKSTINEIVHQCFEVFDRSESGAISKKDFAIILRELGDISDNSIIDEIFAEADVDGSGSIDYEEFTYMVRQYMTDEDLNT